MIKQTVLDEAGLLAALFSFAVIMLLLFCRWKMTKLARPDNPLLGKPFRNWFFLILLFVPLAYFAPGAGIFFTAALGLHTARMHVVLGMLLIQGEENYTRSLLAVYQQPGPAILYINASNLFYLALGCTLMLLSPHIRSWIFPLGAGIAYLGLVYFFLILFHHRRIRRRPEAITAWVDSNFPPEGA